MEVYYLQQSSAKELFALRFRITLINCEYPENSVYQQQGSATVARERGQAFDFAPELGEIMLRCLGGS